MLKDLSNSNIEIWQIKEMLIILTLFGLLLTVLFKNLLHHTCVLISNVIIRSETSRIFSLSESTNAQSLLCNDIMDPDCFERWRYLLLIQVTTRSICSFTVCNGCCTDLSRFAMSFGHPHKGPVFWSVVHSVTKEYTSHQSKHSFIQFSSVQSLSVQLFATPWTAAHQASLSNTNSRSLPKLISIELVMPSNHLILCRPLLFVPSIFPNIMVFSNESALCIRWPNIGVSASTSVLPMNNQNWSPLGWTGWISLQSKGLSRVFSNTTVQKHQFFSARFSL